MNAVNPPMLPTGGNPHTSTKLPTLQSMNLSSEVQGFLNSAMEAVEEQQRQRDTVTSNIAAHVRRCWTAARDHRMSEGVDERMRQSLRQRKGEYDPDKLRAIRDAGVSEIYMMITSVKCRAAHAWLRDIINGETGEQIWGTVAPTPQPDLPPGVTEGIRTQISREVGAAVAHGVYLTKEEVDQRQRAAEQQIKRIINERARMDAEDTEERMNDVLVEGGWQKALETSIDDMVTFPAGIIAGPILRRKPKLHWQKRPAGVAGWSAAVHEEIVEEFERVDPRDFYPEPGISEISEGYCIRKHRLSMNDLDQLKGSPGYSSEKIDEVKREFGRGGLQDWSTRDTDFDIAPGVHNPNFKPDWTSPIDVVEFWGTLPGEALIEWGMTNDGVDTNKMYNASVWLVGRHVIRAVLNPDALGRKPFTKFCYEQIPGSFWGNGVPDLIRDVQTVCNATARALVNNAAIASGPQVWANMDRLPPGADVTRLQPWKVWQTNSDEGMSTAAPMGFFQPNMHVNDLVNVYNQFSDKADEYSGVPRYMTGNEQTGGAARTASGLSMLMGNANKLMKHVVANIDKAVDDILQRLHLHLIHVRQDPRIRGDIRIVVRGAESVAVKDTLAMRRAEVLGQTANPIDIAIFGAEGRAELWRENLKELGINADKVVPPPEVVRERAVLIEKAMRDQIAQEQIGGGGGTNAGAPPPAPNADAPGDLQLRA